jgi:hypothetical protein
VSLPAAWMTQARSDYRAAQRLDNPQDPTTHCQAIAKYQQCAERSIKAVLDKLHAANLVAQGSDSKHPVARYAQTFALIPRARGNRNLLNQLSAVFTAPVIDGVKLLDALVPKYQPPPLPQRRKHEYPYQDAAFDCHAPAEPTAFSMGEMKRIRGCTGRLMNRLPRILSALNLLYP